MKDKDEKSEFLKRFSNNEGSYDGVTVDAKESVNNACGEGNELNTAKGEAAERVSGNGTEELETERADLEREGSQKQSAITGKALEIDLEDVIGTARKDYIARQLDAWANEAERTLKKYPEFDLSHAVKDKRFLAMIRSGVGLECAFKALNYDALLKREVSQALSAFVENVRARGMRPSENGITQSGGISIGRGAGAFSRKERAEIARRVENGERIIL